MSIQLTPDERTREVVRRLHRVCARVAPIRGVSMTDIRFERGTTPAEKTAAQAAFDAEPREPKRPKSVDVIITWLESLTAEQQLALILRCVAYFIRERIPWFPREQSLGFDAEETDI